MGRTQGGNNNAYGQDNAISWFDWSAPDESRAAAVGDTVTVRPRSILVLQSNPASGG